MLMPETLRVLSVVLCAAGLALCAPPESFHIRNKKFGDLLRPRNASHMDGTALVLYPAKLWKCLTLKFVPAGESTFQLENHYTSKSFAPDQAAAGAQARVKQVPLSSQSANQPSWKFTKLPGGEYRIVDRSSGRCLTAIPEGGSGEVFVFTAPCLDSGEQKWELVKAPDKLEM